MTETRDKIVIESTTQGVDQSTDKLKGLAGAFDGVTVASEKTEKSTASIESKFASLERRFSTTAGQTAQFEKIQSQVNLAVAQNPALQERANAVLSAAEARYLGVAKATTELATAHKGLDAQGQAALHSVRSVVEQLALGIPPTQALTGQLNHLTFAATGEGGLAGAFKQVGGLIGGLLTPTTAAIAGTVALTAAAAALAVQYDKVSVSSQRALIGAGERTGTSVADLNQFTAQNSGLSGSGLSAKEARGLAEDFTKTGEIVISRLHGMSDAVVGFANQTGQSMDEARKAIVGFAVDPKKALDELAKTYGSFDVATRKAVDALILADDKTGAFQVVIDALSEQSKKAADNMGVLEKAYRGVVNVLATETVKPSGLESQLEAARGRLNAAIEGAPSGSDARAGVASADIAKLSREFEILSAAMEKVKAQNVAAEFNKLSTAADAADRALTPQIAQIEQLTRAIGELERARAAGATSKYGADVDSAALQAAQNQLAALNESKDAAARYNQQVAAISQAWGNVGQSTALQLQHMQNALPVAEAWTNATRMRAQEEATYLSLIQQGRTEEEASALAAKEYELSKAAAVASAQKLVQASEDNLDKIRAQGTGMEGVVASAIAYRDAIEAGATATQAAAISANVLQANLIQAARASQQMEQQAAMAANSAFGSIYDSNGNFVDSREWQAARNAPPTRATSTYDPGGYLASVAVQNYYQNSGGIGGIADRAYATGGVNAALSAAQNSPNSFGATSTQAAFGAYGGYDLNKLLGSYQSNIGEKISTVDQLTQLKNSQTSDRGAQISNLQNELAWLNTLPISLERDQKIVDLRKSIDSLTNSTDSLNATQASLNPLYNGRGALHVGYYKAASGLDMIAQGPSVGDQVPFRAMVNGGERITITPKNQQAGSNDNGRTVINNNSFVFSAVASRRRRSARQERQFVARYGQLMAERS